MSYAFGRICLDVQVRRETAAGKRHQNEQVKFAAKTVGQVELAVVENGSTDDGSQTGHGAV